VYSGAANQEDRAYGVAVDSNDDIFVTGSVTVAGQGLDIWVRKYSPAGAQVWERMHNGDADDTDRGWQVATDSEGDVIVVGSEETTAGGFDIWIRKYTTGGQEVWTETFDQGGAEVAYGVAVDSLDNIIVGGEVSHITQGWNVFVRKYDADANEAWTDIYDYAGESDAATVVSTDSAGNVLVGGYHGVPESARFLRKYDALGNEDWTDQVNESDDEMRGIVTNGMDEIFVSGHGDQNRAFLTKYLANGTSQWTRWYAGAEGNAAGALGLAIDSDENLVIAGWEDTVAGNHDIFVRKYSPTGTHYWTRTYGGPAGESDYAWDVAVDSNDNIIVVGWEVVTNQGDNVWIRKYSP
jgi:uncharacterized delta-60 repeat protein